MRAKLAVIVTVLAATYVAAAAQQNPFVGRWNITGTGADNHQIYFLEVKQNGAELVGLFLDRVGARPPVPSIRVENGELAWQFGGGGETLPKPACGPTYHARIENGKLIGHHLRRAIRARAPARGSAAKPPPQRRQPLQPRRPLRRKPRRRRGRSTGSACVSRCSRRRTRTATTRTASRW